MAQFFHLVLMLISRSCKPMTPSGCNYSCSKYVRAVCVKNEGARSGLLTLMSEYNHSCPVTLRIAYAKI